MIHCIAVHMIFYWLTFYGSTASIIANWRFQRARKSLIKLQTVVLSDCATQNLKNSRAQTKCEKNITAWVSACRKTMPNYLRNESSIHHPRLLILNNLRVDMITKEVKYWKPQSADASRFWTTDILLSR